MNRDVFNINKLVRANIKTLKPYSSARDEYQAELSDMVFLDANENPFQNGMNRYPDPQQTLLKLELSKIKNVPTENILLGNGSDERSEEHTSELQSRPHLVCRLLLEKKKKNKK